MVIETDKCSCEITEVTKVEGEAIANNRKGKLIFFYELVVEADWKGSLKDSDNKTKYKGKIDVPNLSEENEAHELNVNVSCTGESDDAHKVKEEMRLKGGDLIKERLGQYITDLKQEYSKGLILPTKNNSSQQATTPKPPVTNAKSALSTPITSSSSSAAAPKFTTKKFTLREEFFCEPADLFKVFVEKAFIEAFTRGPANVDKKEGGSFSYFGGNVTGFFQEMDPPSKLRMRWRRQEWPSEHYSEVLLTLSAFEGGTKLEVLHSGVPSSAAEGTKAGWKDHYFVPIRQTFGFGRTL